MNKRTMSESESDRNEITETVTLEYVFRLVTMITGWSVSVDRNIADLVQEVEQFF